MPEVDGAEVERRVARFVAGSRAAGLKLTPQRLAIFREVAARIDHPDAEAVLRAVRARMPMVSLDTVYRTLGRLDELGLVAALGPRHESVRFDANLEHHHHYVCLRCGLVRDFASEELDGLRAPAAVKRLGSVLATHVEVRGICAGCAGEQAQGPSSKQAKRPRGRRREKR